MMLDEILKQVETLSISGNTGIDISGISYDSRKTGQGSLFVAVNGEKVDGHDFVDDAIKKGAVAVVYEKAVTSNKLRVTSKENNSSFVTRNLSLIHVKDSRRALACLANNFFRRPSNELNVIGVTGTNGKTITTYLIKSILESWGEKVGLIGTIQYMIKNEVYDAVHTTPEAVEFQGLLHRMLASDCTYIVSEVSSHALAQKRVDGTIFKSGVFTNLTRDHLDFHKTMENYFMAKERLFSELLDEHGSSVVNFDDPYGKKLISSLVADRPGSPKSRHGSTELAEGSLLNIFTYGLERGSDIMAAEIDNSFDGLKFEIVMRGRRYNVISPLMGLPNVYNILSAAGVAISLGVPWDAILDGINKVGAIKGRFEKIDMGQQFLAFIDYAHTEDALQRLINTAKGLTKGKIITVFGCGGDRDRGKRLKMGAIATGSSDFVIITSDNPRSEDPEKIIKEIEAGAAGRNYLIEPDRKEAIKRSVMMASDGDIVLIAGKGHEIYQEIEGKRYEFSDREVLEEAIRQVITNN